MAEYQVFSWNGIPTGVRAFDKAGQARTELSPRFQVAIDDIAMRAGRTESEDYLADWAWSDREDRPGSATDVAREVAAELEAAYPPERLRELRTDLGARLVEPD